MLYVILVTPSICTMLFLNVFLNQAEPPREQASGRNDQIDLQVGSYCVKHCQQKCTKLCCSSTPRPLFNPTCSTTSVREVSVTCLLSSRLPCHPVCCAEISGAKPLLMPLVGSHPLSQSVIQLLRCSILLADAYYEQSPIHQPV